MSSSSTGPAASAGPVVLLTGAMEDAGLQLARAVLAQGGRIAAPVPRAWQVEQLRGQLRAAEGQLLIGVVAEGDAEAAAGFVKGAIDVLGPISHFAGMATCVRAPKPGCEPAGDLDEMLRLNLHANAVLARAVLARMRRAHSGSLLFASEARKKTPLSATCAASLSALRALAAGIAADIAIDAASTGVLVHQLAVVGANDVESLGQWFVALGLRI